jgi:lipopolysaccharide biosynthesis glycosyltransferase
MNNPIIPIVFASDNNYVPYMSTTMQSIMENADRDRVYIFHILHRNISESNIDLLKSQLSVFPHFSLKMIDMSENIGNNDFFVSRNITVETYFRLFIPELLGNYQKVIYLDCDIICNVNIALLFDTDLGNHLLAAVRDSAVAWYYSNKDKKLFRNWHQVLLHLTNPENYFNAGMALINIELFRKTVSTNEILKLATSRKWQLHDQDILNYLVEGKTLFLPYRWNFMYEKYTTHLPEHLKKEYNEARKNPYIIHYKPWNCENYTEHFELFWKYATRTPFIETIIEQMRTKELISNRSLKEKVISKIKGKLKKGTQR